MRTRRLLALCVIGAATAIPASAGVVFHATTAAFATATGGFANLGTEDFESSTLAPNSIVTFDDPLAPGIANGVFPAGTNPAIGMTVQSNTLGGSATVASPNGIGGLATASAGLAGTPDDQVSTDKQRDSFDMIFVSPVVEPIVAVGFKPLYFDSGSATVRGNITVQVFSTANVLLGSTVVAGVDYQNEVAFLGIVATGADDIGRINLWDGNDLLHWQGADDIAVFAAAPTNGTPEPASLLLAGLALAQFGWARRRARKA